MKYPALLAAFLVTLTTVIHAETEPYNCGFEGVDAVETKVFPDQSDSKTFSFKYQVVGKLDPEEIVVIVIPGGPGGSSINDFSNPEVRNKKILNAYPANVPWITIDPRTVGCNRGDETLFPDESLTSANLAHDILSVVEKLRLKKYVLYGHSYGSQSATYVAALATERGLPTPHAIFLSGVLGRGEKDGSYSIPFNLSLQWELLKKKLPESFLETLSTEKPFGIEK